MYSVEYSKSSIDGTGEGPSIPVPRESGAKNWAIQAVKTGVAGAMDVDLQGSLNGTDWFKMVDHSNTSGDITWTADKPVSFVRYNVTSQTDPDTIAIWILGVP